MEEYRVDFFGSSVISLNFLEYFQTEDKDRCQLFLVQFILKSNLSYLDTVLPYLLELQFWPT